jgi:hypothetical protein
VPIVLKSGSLNLLEPSGPVQICNGIALPLPLFYYRTLVDLNQDLVPDEKHRISSSKSPASVLVGSCQAKGVTFC